MISDQAQSDQAQGKHNDKWSSTRKLKQKLSVIFGLITLIVNHN